MAIWRGGAVRSGTRMGASRDGRASARELEPDWLDTCKALIILEIIPTENPNKGRFGIEGGLDGGAATRAVSMVVAHACGLR